VSPASFVFVLGRRCRAAEFHGGRLRSIPMTALLDKSRGIAAAMPQLLKLVPYGTNFKSREAPAPEEQKRPDASPAFDCLLDS
jgi:hypothetical protein